MWGGPWSAWAGPKEGEACLVRVCSSSWFDCQESVAQLLASLEAPGLLQWYPLVKAVAIKGPWKEKDLTPRFLGVAEKAQGLLLSSAGASGKAQTFSSPARITPTFC